MIIIHEIKKSRKMEIAHKFQVYFYLDFLEKYGVDAIGEINYPLMNKKIQLKLNNKIKNDLETIYEKINRIINGILPTTQRKPYCKKCAYFEFCFSDEK